MIIKVFDDKPSLGRAAAIQAADAIRRAIRTNDRARMIAATGASQFELLDALTSFRDIDWERVEMFHLDEYIGLPADHPASFRNYLLTRLINRVGIKDHHLLDGEQDPAEVIRQVGNALQTAPIDVALVGIGENGHLAFNDPPADFDTEEPYLVVTLDEACRRQQLGEGWFTHLAAVPRRAISMGIRQILKAHEIIGASTGCAKGESRGGMLRRGDRSAGARLDSPHASRHHPVSGQKLRRTAHTSSQLPHVVSGFSRTVTSRT